MEAETTNNLRELRKAAGVRQRDLAEYLECDIQTISRFENGKRDPSLAMGLRIAEYFNRSVESIFSRNNPK